MTQPQTFRVNGALEEGMSNSYGIWRGVKILALEKEIYIEPHCQFPGLLIPLKQEFAFLQTKYPPAPSQYIGNCIVFHSKYSPTYKIDHLEIIRVHAIGFGRRVGEGDGRGGGMGEVGWVGEVGGYFGVACRLSLVPLSFVFSLNVFNEFIDFSDKIFPRIRLNLNLQPLI